MSGLARKRLTDCDLVDPLLAAGGGLDEPVVFDAEGGAVAGFEVWRDFVDIAEFAVVVFEFIGHALSSRGRAALRSRTRCSLSRVKSPPRLALTKRFLYIGSMHGDEPMMFEMVAVGAMARTLLLRMPCLAIFSRSGVQSMRPPRGDFDRHAALLFEKVERVRREQAAVPLAALVA